jgi:hypothetical protein
VDKNLFPNSDGMLLGYKIESVNGNENPMSKPLYDEIIMKMEQDNYSMEQVTNTTNGDEVSNLKKTKHMHQGVQSQKAVLIVSSKAVYQIGIDTSCPFTINSSRLNVSSANLLQPRNTN